MTKPDVKLINELRVYSEESKELNLATFWSSSPVILVFVRHFSSSTCRQQVKNFWKQKDKLLRNKFRVVFVGSGSPMSIKDFRKAIEIDNVSFVTDPTMKTFEAFGLTNSGYQSQMGGVVVLQTNGKVLYHFVAGYSGATDDAFDNILTSVA